MKKRGLIPMDETNEKADAEQTKETQKA